MIKLYTDTNFPKPSNGYYTFPLLEQLEKTNSKVHSAFQLVNEIDNSDFTILPVSIEYLYHNNKRNLVQEFFEISKKHNKPILVFSGGDFGVSIDRSDVFTVRLGGFASKMDEKTFIMPPFISDPNEYLGTAFTLLSKEEKPTIGFVGHSNASASKYIKEYMLFLAGNLKRLRKKDATDFQKFYPSSHFRFRYLSLIQKEKSIISNFIFRKNYRAGVKTEADKKKTTLEFYQNIRDNLYTFCIRGTGNFSVRFYETLAMGRIPVLIDTDCKLPFSSEIEWKNHCVIVSEKDIKSIGSRLIKFHEIHSEKELMDIQQKNRDLWINFFVRDSYFNHIARELQTALKSKA